MTFHGQRIDQIDEKPISHNLREHLPKESIALVLSANQNGVSSILAERGASSPKSVVGCGPTGA
jgi:hypothetical protein